MCSDGQRKRVRNSIFKKRAVTISPFIRGGSSTDAERKKQLLAGKTL